MVAGPIAFAFATAIDKELANAMGARLMVTASLLGLIIGLCSESFALLALGGSICDFRLFLQELPKLFFGWALPSFSFVSFDFHLMCRFK